MRDIKGYDGLYAVTSCGKVWSYKREKFLKASDCTSGYLQVTLRKCGKSKQLLVHRLVADAYLKNVENLKEVNHKDKNRHNNCVNNLEWCEHDYNVRYSRCKKCICVETGEVFENPLDASKKLGIRYCYITSCCRNKEKDINGLHFKYL